jgi:hypothetical protein
MDIKESQYTRCAGGTKGLPQLEGIKINGHWAIIYSKYGIGCALDGTHSSDCKGYMPGDAARIAGNVLFYSTMP